MEFVRCLVFLIGSGGPRYCFLQIQSCKKKDLQKVCIYFRGKYNLQNLDRFFSESLFHILRHEFMNNNCYFRIFVKVQYNILLWSSLQAISQHFLPEGMLLQ